MAKGGGDRRQRDKVRAWAKEFRSGINEYVYRSGNGHGPQMWPLIRKVVMRGPWPVLSSGAHLVDLPGVRDSNAARANVAATFLKNCSCVWIVAPIKRAVDDRTAKELMGDTFKRRLLMDGQYGNVAFVCTQTDDCEPSEIWRDHEDVAARVPGRHARMKELHEALEQATQEQSKLDNERDDKDEELQTLKESALEAKSAKREATRGVDRQKKEARRQQAKVDAAGNDGDDDVMEVDGGDGEEDGKRDEDEDEDAAEGGCDLEAEKAALVAIESDLKAAEDLLASAEDSFQELQGAFRKMNKEHQQWMKEVFRKCIRKLNRKSSALQREFKPLCACVRNEYSTAQLKEDFKTGLKDLLRVNGDDGDAEEEYDEDEQGGASSASASALDNIELPVFCISANDYLKVAGIKSSGDGKAATFCDPESTNIPSLFQFVSTLTSRRRDVAARSLLRASSDLLNGIKLYIADSGTADEALGETAKHAFESQAESLQRTMQQCSASFTAAVRQRVKDSLKPAVDAGTAQARSAALTTVTTWGSKDRRSREQRNGGGLYWGTYQATVRRDGVYNSGSCGAIDMNQELTDPVEAAMMVGWNTTMNAAITTQLETCGRGMQVEGQDANSALVMSMGRVGVPPTRLRPMGVQAARVIKSDITTALAEIKEYAATTGRDTNRSLLPEIQARMKPGYTKTMEVEKGPGKFNRMKGAMNLHAESSLASMFQSASDGLLEKVSQ
jgi:hypothetical protein